MRLRTLTAGALLLAAVPACSSSSASPVDTSVEAASRVAYGDHPDQWADLTVPAGEGPFPVVVLLHGGSWYDRFPADSVEPLAVDLVAHGWAVLNVEYRRIGGGGGWPMTFLDVATAVDQLPGTDGRLDLDRVAFVGHSAGGTLALWAAARHTFVGTAYGSLPAVDACAVASLAGVTDLELAARRSLGRGSVWRLLDGGPDDVPDRYAAASPLRLLPIGTPTLVVHGTEDLVVGLDTATAYTIAAAAAGDDVEMLEIDGNHFAVIDPDGEAWPRVRSWLRDTC